MESTVKERLTAYLAYKRISKSEFGRRIGASSAFVTSIRRSISPENIQSIAKEFPDLNISWLVTGEGSMLKEPQSRVNNVNIVTGDSAHDNNLGSTVNVQRGSDANIVQELVRTNTKLAEQIDRLTIILDRLTK